jgi:hypothetical protein
MGLFHQAIMMYHVSYIIIQKTTESLSPLFGSVGAAFHGDARHDPASEGVFKKSRRSTSTRDRVGEIPSPAAPKVLLARYI